ncbi:MAG: hypothetical protein F6K19_25090 [Cyanothece sp. SIO1E1]|nr:hypothetical protein [Cyanothece sp. SIO1E1]
MKAQCVKNIVPALALLGLTLGSCSPSQTTSDGNGPVPQQSLQAEASDALSNGSVSERAKQQVGWFRRLLGLGTANDSTPTASEQMLTSIDQRSQIMLPAGWGSTRKLHPSAEIQAANIEDEMYLLVLSENRDNLPEQTIQDHSESYRKFLTDGMRYLQSQTYTKGGDINGNLAVQHEIRGALEGRSLVYLHTTIKAEDAYYQIVAWTSSSRYERNKSELEKIINSFKTV